ncbi:MAG: hypothetical protein LC658_08745, partial [Bacteroidales bacterium]|nr:hypothetical protein [Bacteroidales bacterium]
RVKMQKKQSRNSFFNELRLMFSAKPFWFLSFHRHLFIASQGVCYIAGLCDMAISGIVRN